MPVFSKDGRNILYAHVPKTGGSSLERTFVGSGWSMHVHDGNVGPKSLNNLRRCTPQHMHASMLRDMFVIRRFDLVIMTVREPLARFRSEYGMRNQTGDVDEKSVEAWAANVFERYTHNHFLFDNHIRPQAEFHFPRGKVYRLEEGLDTIVERLNDEHGLGLSPAPRRVHDRQGRSGFKSSDVRLSRSLERRLREFYAQDFELFGY